MDAVHHLSVDIETYSDVDIGKAGLYKYAESPVFQILLFAYKLDDTPPKVIDLTAELLSPELIRMLLDPSVIKHAYNAAFEWYCLSRYLRLVEAQRNAWLGRNGAAPCSMAYTAAIPPDWRPWDGRWDCRKKSKSWRWARL